MSCLDTIHLYLHDTVHFGTGKDRKATPRPDGLVRFYNHLILDSPWSQPSSARHQQYIISPPRPHEKTKSRKFSTIFAAGGGSKHTFFDAPVKCFDPIQGVLFRNSKCNFGIKVGEYSKGGNGCTLFSNQFFFLSKESLIKLII